MIKVIILTVWLTIGVIVNLYEHGNKVVANFWFYLIRTLIVLGFIYWFSL